VGDLDSSAGKRALGTLRREGQQLVFQWATPLPPPELARQLANCQLQLRHGGQSSLVQLRKRLKLGPLNLDMSKDKQIVEMIAADPPKLDSLRLEIRDVTSLPAGAKVRREQTVLALGKLGAREMTSTSDLDLIVIYDFDSTRPEASGPRALYGAQYFSRFTQHLTGALTARTNYGALYQVDMRLRPSGRAGPLATQIEGFASYQENEAWTWEHMALTRARVVSASRAFAQRVEAVLRDVLCRKRDRKEVAADVLEMRRAIAAEKGEGDHWDLKNAAGGLIDIEFIAQFLQLVHAWHAPELLDTSTARVIDKAARLGLLAIEDGEVLRPAVRLYVDLTQILRLCLPTKFDSSKAAPGVLALLARAADLPDFATLEPFLVETQSKVRAILLRIASA